MLSLLGGILLFSACSDDSGSIQITASQPEVETDDTTEIFIVDRTGKRWEISHARDKYGLDPSEFQFGLGPNAIRPVMQPIHISPGESGYPSDGASFFVMGTSLEGDTRAYRIDKMSFHEVVNDEFSGTHVAVAY
jgi:hypothetical protein